MIEFVMLPAKNILMYCVMCQVIATSVVQMRLALPTGLARPFEKISLAMSMKLSQLKSSQAPGPNCPRRRVKGRSGFTMLTWLRVSPVKR
jgi:hypothetical protein